MNAPCCPVCMDKPMTVENSFLFSTVIGTNVYDVIHQRKVRFTNGYSSLCVIPAHTQVQIGLNIILEKCVVNV